MSYTYIVTSPLWYLNVKTHHHIAMFVQNWVINTLFDHSAKVNTWINQPLSSCVYVRAPRVDDQNTWPGRYLLFPPSSAVGTTYARLVRRPLGDTKLIPILSLVWSHPVFRQRATGTAKGPNAESEKGGWTENETLRYVGVRRSALSANCVRTWISILLRSYYQMRKLSTKTRGKL